MLTADIDLNRQEWTSIGTKNKPYMGTFDGQNHIIHGIWSTDESNAIQGLFGYIGRNYSNRSDYGTVKNVKAAGRIRAVQSAGSGSSRVPTRARSTTRGFRFPRQLEGHFRHRRHCGLHDRRLHRKRRTYGLFLTTDDSKYSSNMVNSIGGIGRRSRGQ